jgi:ketosteroid isomerase-like protein
MKTVQRAVAVSILAILAGCGTQQPPPDPMVLVNSEQAFGATAAQKGMRDAFLEFSTDEAVMFVPGVIRVKDLYGPAEPRPGLLVWHPLYAEIASSGDLGWTTGPWEWGQDMSGQSFQATGNYITIWRRQPDSTWKFVLDVGVAHRSPMAQYPAPTLRVLDRPSERQRVEPGLGRQQLLEAEYSFRSASVSEGMAAAYQPRMTEDVRYYRMGMLPIHGIDSVTAALSRSVGTYSWEVDYAEVSLNSDLGYTYGSSSLSDGTGSLKFSFIRIWRRNIEGIWKVALDIHIPYQTPEQKS